MPHAASIYVKLRSLARGSSPQWGRKVRVCRLASGLASGHEFTGIRRYSWLQPYQASGSDSASGPTSAATRSCCPTRTNRQPSAEQNTFEKFGLTLREVCRRSDQEGRGRRGKK